MENCKHGESWCLNFLNPNRKTPFGEPEEVVCDTWPEAHLIARDGDTIGAAIIAYAAKWKDHKDFPAAPWDPRRGEIHLRDLDAREEAADEPPRYRLKATGFIGGVLYDPGAEVQWDHWLNRNNANLISNLEPLNESARRIVRYTQKFLVGRNMPGQPYSLGKLNMPNPALFGKPEPITHRGQFGGRSVVA
ncbi:hypothetical protein ACVWW4_000861 [Bradyrhizobium sp. LB7.1]